MSQTFHHTDADNSTLANICQVAAERFADNAKQFRTLIDVEPDPESMMQITGEGARRLAEQFDKQAEEARAFAQRFMFAESVTVVTEAADDEEVD